MPAQAGPDELPVDEEAAEGDTVIELVGGRPFIYDKTAQNERDMAKLRGER